MVRQRGLLAKYERDGGGGAGIRADLFGRAEKAGRLGWLERRRAESRTRFKRKVLRVNGAEVMPRPQQQQPTPFASCARSLLPFSPLRDRSPLLPLSVPFSLPRAFHLLVGPVGGAEGRTLNSLFHPRVLSSL
jgi:hypothetical protein